MSKPAYPPTRTDNIVERLHGESIPDPYRWLEDGESAEVQAWTAAQNGLTEHYLGQVPFRPEIRRRLTELLAIDSLGAPTPAGGRYFYSRRRQNENQPILYVREGVHGPDRVLLDPNRLNPDGTTALDWYFPSEDGRMLAYGLSEDGSEESVLRVMDVTTGVVLPDRIERTRAADLAWLPDASGFYYTRNPRKGEVPDTEAQYHRAIYFHRLGDLQEADAHIFSPREKEHWPGVSLSPDGRWLVITVARTFDQTDLYLQDRQEHGPLTPVVVDLPYTYDAEVVKGRLYIRTNEQASTYRLYLADPAAPARDRWREIVAPRADAVLDGFLVTRSRVALSYLERATSRLWLAGLEGGEAREIPLPTIGSVFGWGAEPDGEELFYGFSSFTVPPSVYRVDLVTEQQKLWQRVEADIDPARFEVHQVSYPSRDGTPITMFLVHRRDLVRNGSNATYLTGYGGFNIPMTPGFSRSLLAWLEQGGLVAVPNLRGGGEYGEGWHQAGMLGTKQNTFDDFIAAAEYLIREGYTRPSRLAIAGGSNGGLLMGAVLTQRPDLFRAVVVQVPLLDMLRYHRFLIARLWIPEYGCADDAQQFGWLRAYSPYHHVRSGTSYPAVLLATAESDTRVDPMHARKMAAQLQAANASDRPVLLRLEARAGHGAGKPVSKVLDELVDTWSFVAHELGVSWGRV
ncbi:MAG TPA: prolyl oligopeptidase family serine peptidase [Gemmatimonadales bacterium]|nr:prolyl oligopeptidase family serine peptidase [Gemmatimonadales bacterium]